MEEADDDVDWATASAEAQALIAAACLEEAPNNDGSVTAADPHDLGGADHARALVDRSAPRKATAVVALCDVSRAHNPA
jgi:hypothetical protein